MQDMNEKKIIALYILTGPVLFLSARPSHSVIITSSSRCVSGTPCFLIVIVACQWKAFRFHKSGHITIPALKPWLGEQLEKSQDLSHKQINVFGTDSTFCNYLYACVDRCCKRAGCIATHISRYVLVLPSIVKTRNSWYRSTPQSYLWCPPATKLEHNPNILTTRNVLITR
jgi:hypothetical protein